MEWLPGASRASQPERDADRSDLHRRICRVYLTVKHRVTAFLNVHVHPNNAHFFSQDEISLVGEQLKNSKATDRSKSTIFIKN
jgi:hypothetical protein